MNWRRLGWALGAGGLASLPLALLSLLLLGEAALLLYTAPASALSMALLVLLWDRLGWRPRTRAGWSGLFLLVSVLGAALTGGLGSGLVVLGGLRADPVQARALLALLPQAVASGAGFGVVAGFLSLCAPLGGLLFVLLVRRPPHARYTSPHD